MTAVIILCKPEIAQKETGAREFVICNMKPRLKREGEKGNRLLSSFKTTKKPYCKNNLTQASEMYTLQYLKSPWKLNYIVELNEFKSVQCLKPFLPGNKCLLQNCGYRFLVKEEWLKPLRLPQNHESFCLKWNCQKVSSSGRTHWTWFSFFFFLTLSG